MLVLTGQWILRVFRPIYVVSTAHPSSSRAPWQATTAVQCRHSSRASKRMIKLGIGPDGKPLPQANRKRVHPRMYQVLLVNQDGSTYTIQHRSPLQILTLPLDPSTLSEEEQRERERLRRVAKERVYIDEEEDTEDSWDQSQYRELIDR